MANIPFTRAPLASYVRAAVVVPSDSTVVAFSGVYVGAAGDVAVIPMGQDNAVTFKAVPVGILPIQVSKVMATNTTATNMLGLF